MRIKLVSLLVVLVAVLCTTGCDRGQAHMGAREANLLGVVKVERGNYGSTAASTFAVSTDELYKRKDFSGDKATFLWGLVTLKDY